MVFDRLPASIRELKPWQELCSKLFSNLIGVRVQLFRAFCVPRFVFLVINFLHCSKRFLLDLVGFQVFIQLPLCFEGILLEPEYLCILSALQYTETASSFELVHTLALDKFHKFNPIILLGERIRVDAVLEGASGFLLPRRNKVFCTHVHTSRFSQPSRRSRSRLSVSPKTDVTPGRSFLPP